MTGRVFLSGGGSVQDEEQLWQAMLPGCHRLVYWPFALDGATLAAAHDWLQAELAAPFPDIHIDTWVDLSDHHPGELTGADLLFVGGGNTFQLADQIRRYGFAEPVRRWVNAGGRYYGGSAGAILAADSIRTATSLDRNNIKLRDFRGLSLIPGIAVLPHFTVNQLLAAQATSAVLNLPILAIPEGGAAIIGSDGLTTVGSHRLWTITGIDATEHPAGNRLVTVRVEDGSTLAE